jgi:hypothetical protein
VWQVDHDRANSSLVRPYLWYRSNWRTQCKHLQSWQSP